MRRHAGPIAISSDPGMARRLFLALLSITVLSLCLPVSGANSALTHPFEKVLGGTTNAGPFDRGLCGMGVDHQTEDLLILNFGYDAIDIVDPTTGLLKRRISAADSPGTFEAAYGAAPGECFPGNAGVNNDTGQVFVHDSSHIIKVFDGEGIFEQLIRGGGTPEKRFGDNYVFTEVDQLTGDLYVSSYHYFDLDEGRIHRFSPSGKYLSEIVGNSYPWRMATDSSGNLYVATYGGSAITKYNGAGAKVDEITGSPFGPISQGEFITASTDHLFVFESTERYTSSGSSTVGVIREYDESGNFVGQTAGVDTPDGFLSYDTYGIAATADGRLYVSYGREAPGKILVFGPPVIVPTVTTGPVVQTTKTSAKITGTINPSSASLGADCKVEYGLSLFYDKSVACTSPSIPAGTSPVSVTADLPGLSTGSTYNYRFVSTNANGTNAGPNRTVTAPHVINVKSEAATNVQRTSATLHGSLDPDGVETKFFFEYGTDTSYGEAAPAPPGNSAGSGSGSTPVSINLTGLKPGTEYHFRLRATNGDGTVAGEDLTFTTPPAVKDTATTTAAAVQRTSATLMGSFDPNGEATHYYFDYGLTTGYGQTAPAPPGTDAGSGSGITIGSQAITGLLPGTTYHYRIVASNAVGVSKGLDQTFTTAPAVAGVTTGAATDISLDRATLTGSFDPMGQSTHYYFEYGAGGVISQQVPAPPGVDGGAGTGATPAVIEVENLQPGTTYEYRLVASNAVGLTKGTLQAFTTAQLPDIEAFSSSNLGETFADLNARIRTSGEDTSYRFEYGPSPSFGSSAPVPDGELTGSSSPHEVSVHLEDLQPGTTYFFRVVAENRWGVKTSQTQTFNFAPPECPNARIRQQTGANYLPDCRAYELVSPAQAGGVTLGPSGPRSPYATNPSRLAFNGSIGAIPGAGSPPNSLFDLYVSTRSDLGWSTKYVGLQSDQTLFSGGRMPEIKPSTVLASSDLNRFVIWDLGSGGLCSGSSVFNCGYDWGDNAPHLFNAKGEHLSRLPTNFDEVAENEKFNKQPDEPTPTHRGDQMVSGDVSHFVFAWDDPAFALGGNTSAPGSVYDNEIDTNSVVVASKTAAGANIPQEQPKNGGPKELLEVKDVSEDGSHILIAAPTGPPLLCSRSNGQNFCNTKHPAHLYMRVDGSVTYDVTRGKVAHFVGASRDGSRVLLETAESLTVDDTDESVDIYQWDEAGDTMTRVTKGTGSGSVGNEDDCSSTWTSRCNATVAFTDSTDLAESLDGCFFTYCNSPGANSDNSLAANTAEVYFYSPEQLVGTQGLPGARNLYTVSSGDVQFVASLNPEQPLTRLQVSPDNSHAAFITSSQLTSSPTFEFEVMYTYDTSTKELRCVSCRPDGAPPGFDVKGSQNGLFMTDDGRAFFSTADPLVPRDTNKLRDVYEYVDGRPQLISNGTVSRDGPFGGLVTFGGPAGLVGVSGNGRDVYFSIFEALVGNDQNGSAMRFYDARTNGGFLFDPPPAPCAAADECHGVGSARPSVPPILTEAGLASGNHARKVSKKKARHRKKGKKQRKQQRRRAAARKAGGERR